MTIREYIQDQLLNPFREHPTNIQNTLIEIITQRLEKLYDLTVEFPEIVSPNQNRLDILKAIADQFLFNIRQEADIQEQIDILDNILYVYTKRGSLDTIENMWKYYGGDLPKDIKVIIPSERVFRYSRSPLSGTHVFQDGKTNRTGTYEVRLTNSNYPIDKLRDFMINELAAAGNYFYFTNALSVQVLEGNYSHYRYDIDTDYLHEIQSYIPQKDHGLKWSGYTRLDCKDFDPTWSGKMDVILYLSTMFPLIYIDESDFDLNVSEVSQAPFSKVEFPTYEAETFYENIYNLVPTAYEYNPTIQSKFQDENGEDYPIGEGYFVLGKSLLGTNLNIGFTVS